MKQIKEFGRTRNGDIAKWENVKVKVMELGLSLKFNNEDMKQVLLDTKDDILVECSPYDYFWGVGISKISTKEYIEEDIFDELNKGDNQLGKSLMKIRQSII